MTGVMLHNLCILISQMQWKPPESGQKLIKSIVQLQHCKTIYTLFHGFTDNMRGYFTSCEQRVKCPRVLSVKPSNKRFIIPLHCFPAIFYYFIQ